jgi:hypothetical protein
VIARLPLSQTKPQDKNDENEDATKVPENRTGIGTTLPTLIIWRKKIPQTLRSNHFLLETNITKKEQKNRTEQNRDLQFRSIELGSEHHLEPLPRPRGLSALLLFLLCLTVSLSLFGTPQQRLRMPLSKMYFTATTKNKEWTEIYTKNGSSETARKRLHDIV